MKIVVKLTDQAASELTKTLAMTFLLRDLRNCWLSIILPSK